MKKMSPKTFLKKYPDVAQAYIALNMVLGEEKAQKRVDKMLAKYDR